MVGRYNLKTLMISGTGVMPDLSGIDTPWYNYISYVETVIIADGVTTVADKAFEKCDTLKKVVVSKTVQSIGYGAFAECENLTSVTLNEGLKSIGDYAFASSALTELNIPEGVTTLGSHFIASTSIEKIVVPSTVISYAEAFGNVSSLREAVISNGVKSIDFGAFMMCPYINTVEIPKSVTVIEEYAFWECLNFKTVFYRGTQSQWNSITVKSEANEQLLNANVTYNYEDHTHLFGDYTYRNNATCEKDGTEWSPCVNGCGYVDERTAEGTARGHSFLTYIYNNDATSFADGTETAECSRCDKTDTRVKTGTRINTEVFTDVSAESWYKEYVTYAVGYGLFKGIDDTTFAPDTAMNRAMFVTVLARLYGAPEHSNVYTKFTDVPSGKYYSSAVKWASDAGIVTGISEKEFKPMDNVTREQMCTMLVRFANHTGDALTPSFEKTTFKDDSQIKPYAREAVYICQMSGIVNGMGNDCFVPAGEATRAQVAKILTVYHMEFFNK